MATAILSKTSVCLCLSLAACGDSAAATSANESSGTATTPGISGLGATTSGSSTSCPPGALAGAHYDITKSRFAFGSPPVAMNAGSLVRWVGSDGVVAIFQDGSELGILNGGAPQANLPGWSSDSSKLAAHVIAYWVSMGVEPCQITGPSFTYSASGGGSVDGGMVTFTPGPTNGGLLRGIGGVPVAESLASATFDIDDQTTSESFYWPEIPADVVSAAIAFRNALATPAGFAAYKAKLPADAQGQGQIVIHHTSSSSSAPFQSAVTYDVTAQTSPPPSDSGLLLGGFSQQLSFDPSGNPTTTVW